MGVVRRVVRALAIAVLVANCHSFASSDDAPAGGSQADASPDSGELTFDGSTPHDAEVTDAALGDSGPAPAPPCDGRLECERVVFTTSLKFAGNLGGTEGADFKCNLVAKDSSLARIKGHSFVAWLSGPTAATDRMAHGTGPYVLPDGSRIALEWTVFASIAHERPIDQDESGRPTAGTVWTNTTDDGRAAYNTLYDCKSWMISSGGTTLGLTGNAATRSDGWSNGAGEQCSNTAALYCVER